MLNVSLGPLVSLGRNTRSEKQIISGFINQLDHYWPCLASRKTSARNDADGARRRRKQRRRRDIAVSAWKASPQLQQPSAKRLPRNKEGRLFKGEVDEKTSNPRAPLMASCSEKTPSIWTRLFRGKTDWKQKHRVGAELGGSWPARVLGPRVRNQRWHAALGETTRWFQRPIGSAMLCSDKNRLSTRSPLSGSACPGLLHLARFSQHNGAKIASACSGRSDKKTEIINLFRSGLLHYQYCANLGKSV